VTEGRTGKRFPVHLSVKVAHADKQHTEEIGTTGNMSAAGVYLLMDRGLEVGSNMEFEITVPGEIIGARTDVRLHCTGRVVRNEVRAEEHKTGVACVIESYEFVRESESRKEG